MKKFVSKRFRWIFFLCVLLVVNTVKSATFRWPVEDPQVTQNYAAYEEYVSDQYHVGVDIISETGNLDIFPAAPGRCRVFPMGTFGPTNHGMGNVIIIEHFTSPQLFTIYAHLSQIFVNDDTLIENTDAPIGEMGNTGGEYSIHLHFSLKRWSEFGNLHSDLGPEWGYTPFHPSVGGYLDPSPFLKNNVELLVPTFIGVLPQAKIKSTIPANNEVSYGPNDLATAGPATSFVAYAKVDDWFLVDISSGHGPASGWVRGAGACSDSMCIIFDPTRGTSGVSLRSGPGASFGRLSYVWDRQGFIILSETDEWFEIRTQNEVGEGSGWVSKQYAVRVGVGGGGDDPVADLRIRSLRIYDGIDGKGTGNGNGEANPSEECRLRVRVQNVGDIDLTDVRLEVIASSSNLSIVDGTSRVGTIHSGDSEYDNIDIEFSIDMDVNDGELLEFEIELTSDQGSWRDGFTVQISRDSDDEGFPLEVNELILSDGTYRGGGNEDGVPDAGERIELAMRYTYKFDDRPYRPYYTLESDDPYIRIIDGDSRLSGHLEQGETVFDETGPCFEVSRNCPIGHRITIQVKVIKAVAGKFILYSTNRSFTVEKILPFDRVKIKNLRIDEDRKGVRVEYTSRIGKEYELEYSSDLENWSSITLRSGRPIESSAAFSLSSAPDNLFVRVVERDPQ